MSTNKTSRRRLTVVAAASAATLASTVALLGFPSAIAAATPNPTGSAYPLFLEANNFTGSPANAITGTGWWGHEGASKDQGTYISADAVTNGGQDLLNAFGVSDYDHFGIAFVQTSSGANERPSVTDGEPAGDVYAYFTNFGFTAGLTSNPQADYVATISTQAQQDAWVADGKPTQLIGTDLVSHDTLRTGNPVSAHPQGSSILNTWPANQHMSMVMFVISGTDNNGEPLMKAGADGKAIAAWLPFTTVADCTRPAATSAGYALAGVLVKPTIAMSASSDGAQVSATLMRAGQCGAAATPATDASGTVTFEQSSDGSTWSPAGAPQVESSGTASIATGVTAGQTKIFRATYVPDTAAAVTYDGSQSNNKTVSVPSGNPTGGSTPSQPASSQPSQPVTMPPASTPPAALTAKLKHDQAALKVAQKAFKKAHGAKKAKLKKKITALKKAIKKDLQLIAAARISTSLAGEQ